MAREKTRKLVVLAVMAAIAVVVMWVGRIAIVPAAPFLKYDPKDVVILMAGFLFGPFSAFLVSLTVSLIEMFTVSESGIIGCVMNVLSTCAFVCPAAWLYKRNHTIRGAIFGLVVGILCMTGVMLLWNYFLTPIYMGIPRQAVAAMLLPVFLPFNLLKGTINATLTLLIYKPLVGALRKTRHFPGQGGLASPPAGVAQASKINVGLVIVAAFVLVSCVVGIVLWQGVA
ncbi:ECF transporter S component [Ruminococcaceae bacterium OttesenSCG-928-I18]|nr:ECF transporter S component [Ruminococcaceae bacterium OttesenSCG-928-I18]